MTKEQILKTRYSGIAPDGFVLLTEEAIEKLKDFDIWKKWKNNEISLIELEYETNTDSTNIPD
jgi:hypothetical protein